MIEEKYMRRALQLARGGEGRVAPNPMVGAVVVANGRIIGEGFHRTYGGPHAEVNAIASVLPEDRELLSEATIYVTLEPCSHYGKTPPCAKLIIDTGIPHVVVGAPDPNPLVAGRGVRMMREAGIRVDEDVLKDECIALNKRFMTAHTSGRPWIQLKWAESADRRMAGVDEEGRPVPVRLSSLLSSVWMHRGVRMWRLSWWVRIRAASTIRVLTYAIGVAGIREWLTAPEKWIAAVSWKTCVRRG